MLQHYVLTLNPDSKYDWDRCTLRHPLSNEHPSLAALVQDAIGKAEGQFLVRVEVTVTVLETAPLDPSTPSPATLETVSEPTALTPDSHATEPVPAV